VKNPSPSQLDLARRLLALEGAGGGALECAAAAGRIYDELQVHLSPLVGLAGVQLLLVRSAKIAQGELPRAAEAANLDAAAKLRGWLQALEPAVAMASAEALFGTFIGLLSTFIGERLTTHVLRRAWPTVADATSKENPR